jgi:DNA-binding NarL/FixJ family response regulator
MSARVLLADDHALFRNGVASLLAARQYAVVGQASSGAQAARLAAELKPDLILMDIRMPGLDGLAATRLIKARQPEIKIVILTVSEDDADLFEAIKSGAAGYLPKSLEADQFFALIEAVLRGEAGLTPELANKILREFARDAGARPGAAGPRPGGEPAPDDLTAREHEVLGLVAQGLGNAEIAARLVVSENTVKFHMKNILQKLHARNRAEVVAFAHRLGLFPPD